jgi:predicted MFS family arabinose efflux permease
MTEIRRLWPTILTGVMGNSVLYLIPLLVGAMVTDRGFSEQQAGLTASADLAGYAVATFFTAIALHRFRWRTMAYVALAIMITANIATMFVYQVVPFAAVRFLSGVGGGILAAIATVSLGHTENPDRNYGLLFAASLLFGTAGLWGLPLLLERTGINGGYGLIAALAVLVALIAHRIPSDFTRREAGSAQATSVHWFLAAALLAAIALFWAQQNALYAYLERIGNASGLTVKYIGFVLGAANLTGFVGAALVAFLGGRFGRTVPLVLATAVQLVCLWSLRGHLSPAGYLAAVGVMSVAWNIVNPMQLGILAEVDRDGRALALSATVIGIGLAAGPALAAMTVGDGSYSGILWLAAGLTMASLVLMIPALGKR